MSEFKKWNFQNNPQEALPSFAVHILMESGGDETTINGLIEFLNAVSGKENAEDMADLCNDFQRELFRYTMAFDHAEREYVDKINRSVEYLVPTCEAAFA